MGIYMKKKQQQEGCYKTTIGGQALIEGIMMRGPEKQVIVLRNNDGFTVKEEEVKL
jgi:uncharacterized protein YqhQ